MEINFQDGNYAIDKYSMAIDTIQSRGNYPLPLPISQTMRPMMATTISIPTHTPALKIPPITSQEERRVIRKSKLPYISAFLFIIQLLSFPDAKTLPA
jgi:hypothetical protein